MPGFPARHPKGAMATRFDQPPGAPSAWLADAEPPGFPALSRDEKADVCIIGVLPLFTSCDRWDVGGVSTLHQADIGGPAIVVYDGYQGGAGVAELGYEAAERHVRATAELVAACGCAAGCPSCV